MAPKPTPTKQTAGGASDADLAQHYGLLDRSQLHPIGEEAKADGDPDLEFFGDVGDDLLGEEGTNFCLT